MKKVFLLAAGAFLIYSCNHLSSAESANGTSQQETNLAAAKTINDAFHTGDVSKVDSVVSPDFIDHTERGEVKGTDSLKSMIKMIHSTLKDMKMDIMSQVADSNNQVFELMHFTGNGDGKMVPAGPYDMHAIEVTKYKDGKAVEHWEYDEISEMMKMMSKMQGGMGAMKDSVKKK
ncbi:MAG TPA: ester cyclase [Flavisolibacter sp.]|nr:ester cyclase [Flavisolibacter sp.]